MTLLAKVDVAVVKDSIEISLFSYGNGCDGHRPWQYQYKFKSMIPILTDYFTLQITYAHYYLNKENKTDRSVEMQ